MFQRSTELGVGYKKTRLILGLFWQLSGKESACWCQRHGFDPWLGRSMCHNYWSPGTRELLLPVRNHRGEQPLRHDWRAAPGGLQSTGSLRVGHDWVTSLSLFTLMHSRRKWHPTPVFLPGESQGWGNLVCCHLWGRTESDTTEAT